MTGVRGQQLLQQLPTQGAHRGPDRALQTSQRRCRCRPLTRRPEAGRGLFCQPVQLVRERRFERLEEPPFSPSEPASWALPASLAPGGWTGRASQIASFTEASSSVSALNRRRHPARPGPCRPRRAPTADPPSCRRPAPRPHRPRPVTGMPRPRARTVRLAAATERHAHHPRRKSPTCPSCASNWPRRASSSCSDPSTVLIVHHPQSVCISCSQTRTEIPKPGEPRDHLLMCRAPVCPERVVLQCSSVPSAPALQRSSAPALRVGCTCVEIGVAGGVASAWSTSAATAPRPARLAAAPGLVSRGRRRRLRGQPRSSAPHGQPRCRRRMVSRGRRRRLRGQPGCHRGNTGLAIRDSAGRGFGTTHRDTRHADSHDPAQLARIVTNSNFV